MRGYLNMSGGFDVIDGYDIEMVVYFDPLYLGPNEVPYISVLSPALFINTYMTSTQFFLALQKCLEGINFFSDKEMCKLILSWINTTMFDEHTIRFEEVSFLIDEKEYKVTLSSVIVMILYLYIHKIPGYTVPGAGTFKDKLLGV